jgi:hypothetical protein
MMIKIGRVILTAGMLVISSLSFSWEAKVTKILQHRNVVAVYLEPNPGKGICEYGQPYILLADGEAGNNQKFSMLLTALTAGKTITGYEDACSTEIWGQSRPTISRLIINAD